MKPHVDVGAYLLGALDDAEMTAFEEHLAECEACGQELDELSGLLPVLQELRDDGAVAPVGTGAATGPAAGLAGLLGADAGTSANAAGAAGAAGARPAGGFAAAVADGSAFAGPPSGDGLLERLLARVAAERRTRKRRRLVAVAAAAVLVVGGPAVAVVATNGDGGGRPVTAAADWRASDRANGVSADVAITDKPWGSAVDLHLAGVRGPRVCHLEAVGFDGARQTVATWAVPAQGYGAQARPLTVHGAAALHMPSISRFDVRTVDGTLLVSVSDHSAPGAGAGGAGGE